MARTMTMESIDAKIQEAEEKVVRTGKTYNTACEESIAFFESDPIKTNDDEAKPRGRGGRRKRAEE